MCGWLGWSPSLNHACSALRCMNGSPASTTFRPMPTANAEGARPNRTVASERSRRDASSDTFRSTQVLGVRRRHAPRCRSKKGYEPRYRERLACVHPRRGACEKNLVSRSMPTAKPRTRVDLKVSKDTSRRDLSDATVRPDQAPRRSQSARAEVSRGK